MSIPTILATGFLFLGGILLQLVNMLRYSDWRAIIGPLLMLIGAFPPDPPLGAGLAVLASNAFSPHF